MKTESEFLRESAAIKQEPPPITNERPAVWDIVIADMKARDNFGRARYNTPLQAFNGRDALADAYQEAQDLTVYLCQAIVERDESKRIAAEKVLTFNRCDFERRADLLERSVAELIDGMDRCYESWGDDQNEALHHTRDCLTTLIEVSTHLLNNAAALELPVERCGKCSYCAPPPKPEASKLKITEFVPGWARETEREITIIVDQMMERGVWEEENELVDMEITSIRAETRSLELGQPMNTSRSLYPLFSVSCGRLSLFERDKGIWFLGCPTWEVGMKLRIEVAPSQTNGDYFPNVFVTLGLKKRGL